MNKLTKCFYLYRHKQVRGLLNPLTNPVKTVICSLVLLFGLLQRVLTYQDSKR